MRSRVMRVSAATLLVGAALATMAPHATSLVSSSAVVNAPLLSVRAPFDGVLARGSARLATTVEAGGRLLRIETERQDRTVLEAVRADAIATQAERDAINAQVAAVGAVRADLQDRIVAHDAAATLYLAAVRREVAATRARAEAHRAQLLDERERIARLATSGTATVAALERADADLRMASATVAEAVARREALDLEARALADGIAIDGAVGGGVHARQRLDEVALVLAGLIARRDTLEGRLAALEAQDASIAADLARRGTFEPLSATSGVVWRAAPAEGASVAAGDMVMEVLDCGRRFVEVALPARLFERIHPGDAATVLLKGAARRIGGRVEAVGGPGARFDDASLASDAVEDGTDSIQVLVRLDAADAADPAVAASFCDVGRAAEVRFARDGAGALARIATAVDALGRRLWVWENGNVQVGAGDTPGDRPGAM